MFQFDPATHRYTVGNKIVPSVTQVVHGVMPLGINDTWAMQRGTALHLACALDNQNRLDLATVHDEIRPKLDAWRRFRADFPRVIVANELPLFHEDYQYAGTPDVIFDDDGNSIVCDIKSSVWPQSFVQIGGYSLLWKHRLRKRTRCTGVIVELRDDAQYRAHWMREDQVRRYEQLFLNFLGVFNFVTTTRKDTDAASTVPASHD